MKTESIYQRLENEMEDQYRQIRREVRKYNPRYFINMLRDKGGYETAVALLTPLNPPDGFKTLLLRGRLDLTLETLVYDDPEFNELFSREIILKIGRRLGR